MDTSFVEMILCALLAHYLVLGSRDNMEVMMSHDLWSS